MAAGEKGGAPKRGPWTPRKVEEEPEAPAILLCCDSIPDLVEAGQRIAGCIAIVGGSRINPQAGIISDNTRRMGKRKKRSSESEGSSDEGGGTTARRQSTRQRELAATAARREAEDAAETFRNAVTALQGLDPAIMQAVINAAATNSQVAAAAQSTAAAMMGVETPPTGRGRAGTPTAGAPNVLTPEETRQLMEGSDPPPPGPVEAALPSTTAEGHGSRVTFDLPDDPSQATLLRKLREQERDQEDEDTLIDFMKNQGKEMPQNKKEFGEWMSRVGEPIAVLAMVHDKKHAQIISNVLQYAATRRADRSWRGKWLGALGDRNERGEDPPFVRLKPSYFEWRKVRLPADLEDSGRMAVYYDQRENEGQFCPLEEGDLEATETAVPKFALVPAKIAADALEEGYTPWEVYDALTDFEEGKSEEARDLLKPCKDWAVAAALRGDHGAETSKMAYILTPVSGAPTQVTRDLKSRLNGTLGRHVQEKPKGGGAVLHGPRCEGHRPRGSPVSGGHKADQQRGGRLPRWNSDGHADDEGAGV